MYTQCPDCATVFRITAEALRAAAGDVRCGVCSTTFNALENLSELAFKPAPEGEAPDPGSLMTVEELPGGESIELSAPVELAAVPDAAVQPPPAEPAEDEARAMEFHGDAADLDRLFVVDDAAIAAPQPIDLDSTDEHPIVVIEERDEENIVLETPAAPAPPPIEAVPARAEVAPPLVAPKPQPPPPAPVPTVVVRPAEPDRARDAARLPQPTRAPESAPPPPPARPAPPSSRPPVAHTSGTHTAPRILIPDEMRKRLAEEAAARAAAPMEFEPEEPGSPPIWSRRWVQQAGIAALALLLLAQIIHAERNELVRRPVVGPALAGVYSMFGLAPLAPTDIAAYELRQWGAASDPREANRLMLRASIVNRADFAQPFPLLRLTLQDRFGGTLGERDIMPADYLPGTGTAGLLEPGERADALIRIVDPGTEAVGFELDVCLPAKGGVRCANQIKTASQ